MPQDIPTRIAIVAGILTVTLLLLQIISASYDVVEKQKRAEQKQAPPPAITGSIPKKAKPKPPVPSTPIDDFLSLFKSTPEK